MPCQQLRPHPARLHCSSSPHTAIVRVPLAERGMPGGAPLLCVGQRKRVRAQRLGPAPLGGADACPPAPLSSARLPARPVLSATTVLAPCRIMRPCRRHFLGTRLIRQRVYAAPPPQGRPGGPRKCVFFCDAGALQRRHTQYPVFSYLTQVTLFSSNSGGGAPVGVIAGFRAPACLPGCVGCYPGGDQARRPPGGGHRTSGMWGTGQPEHALGVGDTHTGECSALQGHGATKSAPGAPEKTNSSFNGRPGLVK